jgi:tartrate dehydratase alpha subunit/fumarate hydratase class I-like protein
MITRNIPYHVIVEAVRDLAIRAAYELPGDVKQTLQDAAAKESNPRRPGKSSTN